MTETQPAIKARALAKNYGRATALAGLDLVVEPGTVFGMIGPNGAGKTTTMRLLVDLLRPSSGSVSVLGEDPRAAGPELRKRIGYLPGELRLEGRITGRALLNHYAQISGPIANGSIQALSDRLGLELDRQVRTLSKGNKQKLGIVQAFMHNPPLLVLDEPTSGLDPLVQQEFLAMVREARNNGQTVFLSSHVLSEIQQAADAVAILRAGRILTVSSVDELRQTAVRKVRAGFRGSTAAELTSALSHIPNVSDLRATDGQGPTELAATISGDIDAFVKAIARFPIADLAIEEPDLEESVLKLYGTGSEEVRDEK
jgi:ABC-2 type transport system ATP-binding protein